MHDPKNFEVQQRQQIEREKKAKKRLEIMVNEYMDKNMNQIKQTLRREGVPERDMQEALSIYRKKLAVDIAKDLPEMIKKVKAKRK